MEHLVQHERDEPLRIVGWGESRDAEGRGAAQEEVVAEVEDGTLSLPAHAIALEHIDDPEEVHLAQVGGIQRRW